MLSLYNACECDRVLSRSNRPKSYLLYVLRERVDPSDQDKECEPISPIDSISLEPDRPLWSYIYHGFVAFIKPWLY